MGQRQAWSLRIELQSMTCPAIFFEAWTTKVNPSRIGLMAKIAIQLFAIREFRDGLAGQVQGVAEFEGVWIARFLHADAKFRMVPCELVNHLGEPARRARNGKGILPCPRTEHFVWQAGAFGRRCRHGCRIAMA